VFILCDCIMCANVHVHVHACVCLRIFMRMQRLHMEGCSKLASKFRQNEQACVGMHSFFCRPP